MRSNRRTSNNYKGSFSSIINNRFGDIWNLPNMNGHHGRSEEPGTPSSEDMEDDDETSGLQHGGAVAQGLLDEDDGVMDDGVMDEEYAMHQHQHQEQQQRVSHSQSGDIHRYGQHPNYQGHQHQHQQVGSIHSSYGVPSRKKPKIWDNHGHGTYHYGVHPGYGAQRGFTGFSGGQSWNNFAGTTHINLGGHNIHNRYNKEQTLSRPPKLMRGCPKPISYWSRDEEKQYIIITTTCYHSGYKYHRFGGFGSGGNGNLNNKQIVRNGGNEGCIYKYDIMNDSWDKYRKYRDNGFRPYNHGHAINDSTNELYVFGGNNQIFGYFNLEHHEIDKIYDISKHDDMAYLYPTSIFVAGELHIFTEILVKSKNKRKSLHSIYYPLKQQISKNWIDEKSDLLEKETNDDDIIDDIDDNKENEMKYPIFYCCKVILIRHLKSILMFNGHNGNVDIWSFSLETRKWKLFKTNGIYLKLPKKNTNNFDVILLHDKIVMISYNQSKEIWAFNLDEKYKDNKWSRKNCKSFNGLNDDASMVNIDDNYIHFLNTISPQHYMIWPYYLMPKRIIKRYYAPSIVEYIIRIQNNHLKFYKKKKKFPTDIIKLIADYSCSIFY